ncbi:MAG: 16S rRNA (uracil(1498)-N(3))-methyltransferase [Clostridia bacterium]|nr:16S rRNA (uracil(1498)-N(3))-methyltransferase [Clostridia bacterium]
MPRFFVPKESIDQEKRSVTIGGEDARHISRSLRMAVGDCITVCDGETMEYDCALTSFDNDCVHCEIKDAHALTTEPPFAARIYQALPKGDKLDTVIQKSTECGAASLMTFESEFCIAKEKTDSADRKLERRRRIALEAAKQCGRGIIPEILPTSDFKTAIIEASKADMPIFCYEGEGTVPLGELIRAWKGKIGIEKGNKPEISVVIGSEGGFSSEEAKFAKENGMLMAGLGGRILRSETVAGFVLACLVYEFEL